MKPLKRRHGKQCLYRGSKAYRDAFQRKMHVYHVFMFTGWYRKG
ncbi:hypothetical protein OAM69_02260 [bacterium]|nr:hypothetical protein [bacterium]